MEEVKKANLPTSSITEEAEQAGEVFEQRQRNGIKAQKSVTPKKPVPAKQQRIKRAPKPPFDPVKGFPISAKAAEQLVKGGFLKAPIPKPSQASQVAPTEASGTAYQTARSMQNQYLASDSNVELLNPKLERPVSSQRSYHSFQNQEILISC